MQFFAYVTDDHSIDDAVKSMQKDLDKYMDNVKLSNAEVTFEGNGLKVYSSGGTGDSTTEGGQPSRFIIDFIETHTDEHIIVAFLAIGTDAEIEANATDLSPQTPQKNEKTTLYLLIGFRLFLSNGSGSRTTNTIGSSWSS